MEHRTAEGNYELLCPNGHASDFTLNINGDNYRVECHHCGSIWLGRIQTATQSDTKLIAYGAFYDLTGTSLVIAHQLNFKRVKAAPAKPTQKVGNLSDTVKPGMIVLVFDRTRSGGPQGRIVRVTGIDPDGVQYEYAGVDGILWTGKAKPEWIHLPAVKLTTLPARED